MHRGFGMEGRGNMGGEPVGIGVEMTHLHSESVETEVTPEQVMETARAKRNRKLENIKYRLYSMMYEWSDKLLPGHNVSGYLEAAAKGYDTVSMRKLGPTERALDVVMGASNLLGYNLRIAGKHNASYVASGVSWVAGGLTFGAERIDELVGNKLDAQAREVLNQMGQQWEQFVVNAREFAQRFPGVEIRESGSEFSFEEE